MTRTIRELVETEVIYFISPLVDELLKQEKYREEFYHLTTSTDWDEAEKAISQNICIVQRDVDNLWGVYDKDNEYYTVEPTHENKIEVIKQYFMMSTGIYAITLVKSASGGSSVSGC